MERIWIYQSNRALTAEEGKDLLTRMETFAGQWKAHGKSLSAGVSLQYNRFLIIRVDEEVAQATGCSIDKSVHLLKDIQQDLGVDFFDRMQIAYRDSGGIQAVSRQEFEKLVEQGEVNENTIVFNNMITEADDFSTHWEVPLKNSWHAKVFDVQSF